MKITDLRVVRITGPLRHTQGGGEGTFSKYLIRIDGEGGLYGLGEAEQFFGVREGIEYIKAWLIGRSVFDVRPIVSELLYGSLPPHDEWIPKQYEVSRFKGSNYFPCPSMSPTATTVGPVAWAVSGVEIALCDLAGKALKTPVYNLLGGRFRDRARIYLDRSSPDEKDPTGGSEAWKQMGRDVVASGFTQMKFDIEHICEELTDEFWNRSLTRRQLNLIVKRLSAVREAVGPDVEICVDCHMYYNVPDAIQLAQELAPLKLTWLEDPTPIVNPDAVAEIRRKSTIPICVGEMFTAEQFRLFIDRSACDILHPDVLFCGGLHEAKRIGDYAELHYLPMAMHGNGGCLATIAAAHVAAATRNFLGLEYHFIESKWVSEYVVREGSPLFDRGYVPVTDAPGLGVTLNEKVVREHLASGERMF
jgi:galactonate dehydratase